MLGNPPMVTFDELPRRLGRGQSWAGSSPSTPGHLVHENRPDEFTHHLLSFLDA